jgi:hypothetical protein
MRNSIAMVRNTLNWPGRRIAAYYVRRWRKNCHAQSDAWARDPEDGEWNRAELWLGWASGAGAMLNWLGWDK